MTKDELYTAMDNLEELVNDEISDFSLEKIRHRLSNLKEIESQLKYLINTKKLIQQKIIENRPNLTENQRSKIENDFFYKYLAYDIEYTYSLEEVKSSPLYQIKFKEQLCKKLNIISEQIDVEIESIKSTNKFVSEFDKPENNATRIKKIRWLGTETQFVYLFECLTKSGLLNKNFLETTGGGWAILSKYFENSLGKPFKNTNLAQTSQNMSHNIKTPGKPKGSQIIDNIIEETKTKN